MGILDTGATGLFITTKDSILARILTLGLSNKTIIVADNTIIHASQKTRPPYNLLPSAREGDVIPTFRNSMIGVKPFSDAGCISILHTHQGVVTIHHQDDVQINFLAPPIIKGVIEESGLWGVPLTNNTIHNGDLPKATGNEQAYILHDTPTAQAHNVYELPSISHGIKWMYTVCV